MNLSILNEKCNFCQFFGPRKILFHKYNSVELCLLWRFEVTKVMCGNEAVLLKNKPLNIQKTQAGTFGNTANICYLQKEIDSKQH